MAIDPVTALQENPAVVGAALWSLLIFIIAVTTRSPVATVILTVSLIGALYVGFRPTRTDLAARLLHDDFVTLLVGLLDLALLVLAVAYSSTVLIVLLAVALIGSGLAFLWPVRNV